MNTPDNNPEAPFQEWALVELLGRQKIAGLVTSATIAGAGFIRVDVHKSDGEVAFTRFYSPSAIYSISPVSKAIAIELAKTSFHPVTCWDVPELAKQYIAETAVIPASPDDDENSEIPF